LLARCCAGEGRAAGTGSGCSGCSAALLSGAHLMRDGVLNSHGRAAAPQRLAPRCRACAAISLRAHHRSLARSSRQGRRM